MIETDIKKANDTIAKYRSKLRWAARCLQHDYYCKVCLNEGCHRCGNCHTEICLEDPLIKEVLHG